MNWRIKMEKEKEISKEEMIIMIDNRDQIILDLQVQLENARNSSGRKSQVLELLKENVSISILDISKKLSISTKNVSSQLTYLRTDGYKIFTDNHGKKVLMD
jgi:biotin operon repressor